MHRINRTKVAEWLELNADGETVVPVSELQGLAEFGIAFDEQNQKLRYAEAEASLEVLSPDKVKAIIEQRSLSWLTPGDWSAVEGVELAKSLTRLLKCPNKLDLYKTFSGRTQYQVAVTAIRGDNVLADVEIAEESPSS